MNLAKHKFNLQLLGILHFAESIKARHRYVSPNVSWAGHFAFQAVLKLLDTFKIEPETSGDDMSRETLVSTAK